MGGSLKLDSGGLFDLAESDGFPIRAASVETLTVLYSFFIKEKLKI